MNLTAKQEKFAQSIASGMNNADAYRAAYDAENMKDNSIYRKANDLINNVKVAARISELKKAVENKQLWTREMAVIALLGVMTAPDTKRDVIASIKELNLMHGFDKPENTDSKSLSDALIALAERLPT